MILGVVLAGGQSTRFGSDKALAALEGRTLMDRAVAGLSDCCDSVVIAGRAEGPVRTVSDWPHKGMGPLAGIAAGLRLAQAEGYASVLTCGVDSLSLPGNLAELLSLPPAYIDSQPVIGHWPVSAAPVIQAILQGDGRHSMRAFASAIGARAVKPEAEPANINTPADLAAAEEYYGL